MSRADSPPPPAPRLRVLVADDYSDAGLALSLLLGRWGHESRAVRSAAAAAGALDDFRPHVVLIEPRMPRASDVAAAVVARKAAGESGPALISVSIGDQPSDRAARADMGVRHHFDKPVSCGELRRLLDSLAGRPASDGCGCRG